LELDLRVEIIDIVDNGVKAAVDGLLHGSLRKEKDADHKDSGHKQDVFDQILAPG
jgi:hypothetical protein